MSCPVDCGGCACHINPPCHHCEEWHDCVHEEYELVITSSPLEPEERKMVCVECGAEKEK